jgi:probable F420-dependent oxidoreductase
VDAKPVRAADLATLGADMAGLGKFGLDVGTYGPLANSRTILHLARYAEEAGFGSLWLADHIAFPVSIASRYPYSSSGQFPTSPADPLLEPVATMAVLVGATRRVRIGTAALIMPYRNPLLLARMLVTLDQFSGGRIILGAGVGWLREEFEALGSFDFGRRGQVTDEYLQIFKAVCVGGPVTYRGKTYAFDPVFSSPGSVQRPHPPILIGGMSNAALRRVVRHGNGWLAVAADAERLKERIATLRQFAETAGRPFAQLSLAYKMFLGIGKARNSCMAAREPGTGSLEEIAADITELFGLGFDTIIVRCRASSEGELSGQIERFITKIAPHV